MRSKGVLEGKRKGSKDENEDTSISYLNFINAIKTCYLYVVGLQQTY
jgi:hypothetical protein